MQGVALLPLLGVALLAPRAAHAAWQHASSPVPDAISVDLRTARRCPPRLARKMLHEVAIFDGPQRPRGQRHEHHILTVPGRSAW